MIYVLISIKDTATQCFQPLASVRAEGEALRAFMDAINDPSNKQLHQHPDDFELYVIGHLDDATGEIQPEKPRLILRGKDVRKQG